MAIRDRFLAYLSMLKSHPIFPLSIDLSVLLLIIDSMFETPAETIKHLFLAASRQKIPLDPETQQKNLSELGIRNGDTITLVMKFESAIQTRSLPSNQQKQNQRCRSPNHSSPKRSSPSRRNQSPAPNNNRPNSRNSSNR